jgi:hypothetical protein
MSVRYGSLNRNVRDGGLAAELERQRTGGTPGRSMMGRRSQVEPPSGQLPMPSVPDFSSAVTDAYGGGGPPTVGGLGGMPSSLEYSGITREGDPFGEAWHDAFDKTLEGLRLQNQLRQQPPADVGGGGGGTVTPDYSGAIQKLQDQIAAVSGRYDPYREQLATAATASRGQIDAATTQALARLAQVDPEAAFQWTVQQAQTPGAAGMDYLQAIGANTADVEAVRVLNDALLAQQLAVSQQAAGGYQAALAAERAARQAASNLMRQEALQGLAAQEAAYRAQIQDAERVARDALEQQLIEYELLQAGG